MNKFFRYILSLIIPTLLIIGSLFFVNNIALSKLFDLSTNKKIYFNPRYEQSVIDFKLKANNKKISIVGSSRTAGFEKEMFLSESVYNYSKVTNTINDLFQIIETLDLRRNDTLIIGLDQWNFNDNYLGRQIDIFKKNTLNIPYTLFEDIKEGDVFLVGKKAKENYSGFRNDGSYFYGKRFIVPNHKLEDYNFKNTFDRIELGTRKFEYSSEIDFNELNELEKILHSCENKGITVIAFFPPFAPSVYKRMINMKNNYSYMDKASYNVKKLFNKFDYTFKDFTTMPSFDDSYYLDGFHCNRNVYFEILKQLKVPININFDNDFEISKSELSSLKNYFNIK